MFKRPYSNINPTGTLVQKTFGTEYNTVALVAGELDKIKTVSEALDQISTVVDNFQDIRNANVIKDQLVLIAKHIDDILKCLDVIRYLKENYPTITAIKEKLEEVTKLQKQNEVMLLEEKNFIVELSRALRVNLDEHAKEKIKQLNNHYDKLNKTIVCKVKEFECKLNEFTHKLAELEKLKTVETSNSVLHLQASDAVTQAIDYAVIQPADYLKYVKDAELAIEKSKNAGNDESYNEARLKHYFTGEDEEYWVVEG